MMRLQNFYNLSSRRMKLDSIAESASSVGPLEGNTTGLFNFQVREGGRERGREGLGREGVGRERGREGVGRERGRREGGSERGSEGGRERKGCIFLSHSFPQEEKPVMTFGITDYPSLGFREDLVGTGPVSMATNSWTETYGALSHLAKQLQGKEGDSKAAEDGCCTWCM